MVSRSGPRWQSACSTLSGSKWQHSSRESRYALPQPGSVTLSVFTPAGAQVAVLVRGEQDAGSDQVTFDVTGLSSGIYFYRLVAGGLVQTRKLLLLK